MAISWLTVLRGVPWAQVVANAPKVADGAKKLWRAVGRKRAPIEEPASGPEVSLLPQAKAIAELRSRIASLDAAVSDLHGQMRASSELIRDLAEQNTQLIARIETNRRRTVWLAGAVVVIAVVALACLVLLAGQ